MSTEPTLVDRVIRATFARPLLAVLLVAAGTGIGASWLIALPRDVFPDLSAPVFNVIVQHVTAGAYFSGFTALVQIQDLLSALVKSAVFGFIAAMVSCYKGLYAKGGPKGVGDAVNQGVVITFILIFFANFVMTTLYFALVPQKF